MSHMVRMGLRPASLALATALCFSAGSQAAADPLVAQASVTLSGLSFQLIDLTPVDGIAPSLSFQTQGLIDSGNWAYDEASDSYIQAGPQFQNSLLPSAPMNYTSLDGLSTVTATSNSVVLRTQLPLSQVLPTLTPADGSGAHDYTAQWTGSGTDLAVGDAYHSGVQSFTLGAGTGLVLRGTLSKHVSFDSSSVQQAIEANGYDDWSLQGGVAGSGSFMMAAGVKGLVDTDGNDIGFAVQQGNQLNLDAGHSIMHGQGHDNTALDQSESQDFEFTVVNFGNSELTGVVALNLSVSGNAYASAERYGSVTPPIDVPAIPEPSTYALMGLGLVGITAAARRRRHAV